MSVNANYRHWLMIGASAACLGAAPAVAQQQGDVIVVTAQKRSENIQEVPVSVSVESGQGLREKGQASLVDLGGAVPNLTITDYGNPVITVVTLRGVSQFDFNDHQESPVAVFVDGSYLPYLAGVGSNFFDLDRVEVLRGPQGTLFGRNATGGVIQIVSAKPTEEFEGYAYAEGGNFGAFKGEGAISGPIGGGVLARASVSYDRHNGFFKNSIGKDKGDEENLSWRFQLLKELGDRGDIHFIARGSHDLGVTSSPFQSSPAYPDPSTGLVYDASTDLGAFTAHCEGFFFTTPVANAADCVSGDVEDGDPFTISNNRIGNFDRDMISGSLTVNLDLGGADLTSISSFGYINKDYTNEDSDGTSAETINFGQVYDATDFSQEMRFAGETSRLKWTVGGYYLLINGDYDTRVGFYDGAGIGFDTILGNNYTYDTQSWALFGQTDFSLTDRLTLTTGVRWTNDRKKIQFFAPCTGLCEAFGFTDPAYVQGTGFNDSVPGADTTRNSNNWDAKFQLSYQASDNILLYAGVSRGTKAGGYNASSFALYTIDQTKYDDEVLWSYEAGVKSTLANGRVTLNVGGFYYDYNDVQIFNQLSISTVTFNNDATAYGAEVEMHAVLGEGLTLDLAGSALETSLDPIEFGAGFVDNEELTNAPNLTFSGTLRKEWIIEQGVIGLQADGRYTSDRKLNLIDHPATHEDGYGLLNLRASFAPKSDRWEFSLFARNVLEAEYRLAAIPTVYDSGSVISIYGPPRTYGAALSVKF